MPRGSQWRFIPPVQLAWRGPACRLDSAAFHMKGVPPAFVDLARGDIFCWSSRARITDYLVKECERVYGRTRDDVDASDALSGSVSFHWGQRLTGGDIFKGTLELEVAVGDSSEREAREVKADLIVGADGAGSNTRALLASQVLPLACCCTEFSKTILIST
jgi:2-polyprenyl-6-methoxyphenol hydroxylase-like FAD-dependent oxidoreductase